MRWPFIRVQLVKSITTSPYTEQQFPMYSPNNSPNGEDQQKGTQKARLEP